MMFLNISITMLGYPLQSLKIELTTSVPPNSTSTHFSPKSEKILNFFLLHITTYQFTFTILDTYEEKRYSLFSFELENNVLRCSSVFLGPEVPPNLGAVTILGINQSVTKVIINNFEQAFKYDTLNKVSKLFHLRQLFTNNHI